MDKYMKKSDVIAYIRKEAKEAQSAFDELGVDKRVCREFINRPNGIYNNPVDCAVTHWMPLPKPPKGENDG